jgi:hypothetical protein
MKPYVAQGLLMSCAAVILDAQTIAVSLGTPVFMTEAYFTDVTSAVRLSSGRFIIADPGGRELTVVDPSTARIGVLGREGSGPAEYRDPQYVFPWNGGEALLYDRQLRRFTTWNAKGEYKETLPIVSIGGEVLRVHWADSLGRVFVSRLVGDPSKARQSVVALSLKSGRIDSLADLQVTRAVDRSDGSIGSRVWRFVPYSPADAFCGLSDGGLFLGRAETGRLEWRDRSGVVVHTMQFPAVRQRISDSVRAAVRPVEMQGELGQYLPLFEDYSLVRSSGNRVWLRQTPHGGSTTVWYGFTRASTRILRLELPRRTRILAESEPYLLLVRRLDSDLQRVEAYRISRQ